MTTTGADVRMLWVLEDADRSGGAEAVVRSLDAGLRLRGVPSSVTSWLPDRQPSPAARSWLGTKVRAARHRGAAAARTASQLAAQLEADPQLVVVLDPGSLAVAHHLLDAPRWGIHVQWSPELVLEPWRFVGGDAVPRHLRAVVRARLKAVARRHRRVLRGAPFVVAIAPSHAGLLAGLGRAVDEIRNPVAVALPPAPRPVPARQAPVRVAYVGRLAWEKGPDVFLDALARLPQDTGPVRAVVAGAGPLEEELQQQSSTLGLDVEWLGWVADPARVLREADVLVLPSRTEATPLVLVEALAAGCRVVAADAGSGVRDLLEDGRLGDLVPVDDARALAEALTAAVADVRAGRRADESALVDLAARHDPDRVLDQWTALAERSTGRAERSGR